MEHGHEAIEKLFTVGEINSMAKRLLKTTFGYIWVRGEISSLNIQQSRGHVYMMLKDEAGVLDAAYFGGSSDVLSQKVKIGDQIDAYGSLDIFEKSGKYQLVVRALRLVGAGELNRRYEELKAKLEAEGLFDIARKKELPQIPKCIGLLTSSNAAAYTDFMRILNQRFPNMHVRLLNVPVQGQGAGAKIARAVEYMNKTNACDVLVITRGGGSIEDLWEFNDETLARAVAASNIPVISAVGHERDFTICDYVADLRCPTPTAAAETVVRGQAEMQEAVAHARRHLMSAMQLRMGDVMMRWQRIDNSQIFQRPDELFNVQSQRLDMAFMRLSDLFKTRFWEMQDKVQSGMVRMTLAVGRGVQHLSERHQRLDGMLNALNPKSVLGRGYSILFDKTGHAVRSVLEVQPGDELHAVLSQGEIDVKVTKQL